MITIEQLSGPTPEAAGLIAELDEVLGAVYPPEQRHGYSIAQIFEPNVRFFIARLGSEAVGCGAVALFDDYAEVKRMYTREAVRGSGVGKALLARIEREAREAGKPMLRLETGTLQAAAISLYEAAGFGPCNAFGPYAALPPHRIATSLFYEKPL
ncbi:MAG: GNAT family N-acetyltransferase [Alphaproteobacteria bacterium]|nr:GNAT family N-acetyltransferase [Alphaproteobacteria bacterium]MBV9151817.1 GNAT family N-acetyltransferase [Alphaproteobacteria bacterium]MBV9585091.1 GNAT family N-acetyltransferase [Alphaproteobacteria bacterium]MBV9967892.1 GNAT family N-acetyltransferase [Alphaproteobacteria bacterium]